MSRPYGRTKGAERVVAVDVAGLPAAAVVVPASSHEKRASELMLNHLTRQGATGRVGLVATTLSTAESGGMTSLPPIRRAWRVEVVHGRLGCSRRLAKSFENSTTSATGWLQVACIATTLRHLSRERARRHALAFRSLK